MSQRPDGRYADLHVHTTYSDSTLTPEELIKKAKERGLSALAITDHDIVDGVPLAIEVGEKIGVEIIPGVELTVEREECEIHILGYFIDYKAAWLLEKLKEFCRVRVERAHAMLEKLKEHNVFLTIEDVEQCAGCGSLGRLHIAQAIYKKGYTSSLHEAFKRFIGNKGPCYVRKANLSPLDAIDMIHKAGGLAVLAHPAFMGKDSFILGYIEAGLDGIEVYHTDHSPSAVMHYKAIVDEKGLIATGGSDCHGTHKGEALVGTTKVPYVLVERMKVKCQTKNI